MVPKDGLNLYIAGVEGWVLPERELSKHRKKTRVNNVEILKITLYSVYSSD